MFDVHHYTYNYCLHDNQSTSTLPQATPPALDVSADGAGWGSVFVLLLRANLIKLQVILFPFRHNLWPGDPNHYT